MSIENHVTTLRGFSQMKDKKIEAKEEPKKQYLNHYNPTKWAFRPKYPLTPQNSVSELKEIKKIKKSMCVIL